MHNDNWDDMRFILAVVEAGTVSGAARMLGVNHATVLRRVAAFEARFGTEIFHRTAQGYSVRPDRLRVVEAAREVAIAAESVERVITGLEAPLTGNVRITSTDSLCQMVLPEVLKELRKPLSGLQISLVCANDHLNLSRLEAQVAVRPAAALEVGLVGECGARMGFGVYRREGDVEAGWLGFGGTLRRSLPQPWLERAAGRQGYAAIADSFMVLRELAAQGAGRAVLPCIVGDQDTRLRRERLLSDEYLVPVWVACHEDLTDVPRLTAVRKYLVQALAARRHRFRGDPGSEVADRAEAGADSST